MTDKLLLCATGLCELIAVGGVLLAICMLVEWFDEKSLPKS